MLEGIRKKSFDFFYINPLLGKDGLQIPVVTHLLFLTSIWKLTLNMNTLVIKNAHVPVVVNYIKNRYISDL